MFPVTSLNENLSDFHLNELNPSLLDLSSFFVLLPSQVVTSPLPPQLSLVPPPTFPLSPLHPASPDSKSTSSMVQFHLRIRDILALVVHSHFSFSQQKSIHDQANEKHNTLFGALRVVQDPEGVLK